MTPQEWSEVFLAAITSKSEPAANALALALDAMAHKAAEIASRTRS